MYDEKEIQDSLEFCEEIEFYYESDDFRDPRNLFYQDGLKLPGKVQEKHRNTDVLLPGSSQAVCLTEEDSWKEDLGYKVLEILVGVALAFCIAALFNNFIGTHTIVEGSSMEKTLHNEDCLLVDKLTYHFVKPDRYDIIIFPYNDNTYYIKRIIGLPGERVQIKDGNIYINGTLIEEEYGNEKILDAGVAKRELVLGEDEYFVLGDNRNNSRDSRIAQVGLIKRNKIIGKAFFRIYPFDKISLIKN